MNAAHSRTAERHQGREAALQMLYQWEVGRAPIGEVVRTFGELLQPPASDAAREFGAALAQGTVAHLDRIDPLVAASLQEWRLERLAVIDRLILRLAVYEMQHVPDTPHPVVIDEALELAKRFSAPEAVPFINGVLDHVRRQLVERTS